MSMSRGVFSRSGCLRRSCGKLISSSSSWARLFFRQKQENKKARINNAAIPPTIAPTMAGVLEFDPLPLLALLARPLPVLVFAAAKAVETTVLLSVSASCVATTDPPGNVMDEVA